MYYNCVMENKIIENITEYDETLSRLIPFLGQFPSKQGKEGTAYFIGDDYIVKSIVNSPRQDELAKFFECYIKEQQKFAKEGYLIPKLHAYKIVNSIGADGSSSMSFYTLQDRINGGDIFVRAADSFFENFKRVYDKDYEEETYSEDKEIAYSDMETYIQGFIFQNVFLSKLSQDKFDKLVKTAYNMYKEGEYSIPDIHAGNILVNKNGFNVIDNYMVDRTSNPKFYNVIKPDSFLTSRFLNVFNENLRISKTIKDPRLIKNANIQTLYKLDKENMFYTSKVIKKIMISIKKCIEKDDYFEINSFLAMLRRRLSHYLSQQQTESILKELEK